MDKIRKLKIIMVIGLIMYLPFIATNIAEILGTPLFNNIIPVQLVRGITASLFAICSIIVFVSTIMLNEERRKEIIKSMNNIKKR